tara:strand:- start:179 stop:391 length:213 start_codon:yes stop_codon:yes gene_type:complete
VEKFLLVIQICSAIHGNCLPEQRVNVYDSWYDCAAFGTQETTKLMELIGEDLINNNKIYITFSCRPQNEV